MVAVLWAAVALMVGAGVGVGVGMFWEHDSAVDCLVWNTRAPVGGNHWPSETWCSSNGKTWRARTPKGSSYPACYIEDEPRRSRKEPQ